MIHDVSTDTLDPPPFVALREARMKCRNGADYSGGIHSHSDIAPQAFQLPSEKVFDAALAAANALHWHIAAAAKIEGRIEATATTRFLRFKDDVVIRLRPSDGGGGTRLDIRSASRVGRSDLGTNARRIRRFFELINNCLKTNT